MRKGQTIASLLEAMDPFCHNGDFEEFGGYLWAPFCMPGFPTDAILNPISWLSIILEAYPGFNRWGGKGRFRFGNEIFWIRPEELMQSGMIESIFDHIKTGHRLMLTVTHTYGLVRTWPRNTLVERILKEKGWIDLYKAYLTINPMDDYFRSHPELAAQPFERSNVLVYNWNRYCLVEISSDYQTRDGLPKDSIPVFHDHSFMAAGKMYALVPIAA